LTCTTPMVRHGSSSSIGTIVGLLRRKRIRS
jgi:hypothetical protein